MMLFDDVLCSQTMTGRSSRRKSNEMARVAGPTMSGEENSAEIFLEHKKHPYMKARRLRTENEASASSMSLAVLLMIGCTNRTWDVWWNLCEHVYGAEKLTKEITALHFNHCRREVAQRAHFVYSVRSPGSCYFGY